MDPTPDHSAEIPRVTIEMGGPNIVIRSTPAIDRECTDALTQAVNAAADTDTVVVIDPDPIRCDDSFASSLRRSPGSCTEHRECRPVAARAVSRGVIMIAGEHTSWLVDVAAGRFCQTDAAVDVHFIDPAAWTPVVAICVMPTSMSALTTSGTLVTSKRAHHTATAA